ncbi:MAG: type II toxin-antitoxin system VapC family toxin [Bifidobacteriaceae bacterium]|jgi:predicted nucleic acid-binding protein|nr:type II toxin-antitoxin system VapC family toxin [Bifidobacteriaceae bacterium]
MTGVIAGTGSVLVDSSVPLFALGGPSDLRRPCRQAMDRLAGDGLMFASVEMIQEVAYHRLRMTADPARAAAEARDIEIAVRVVAFDQDILHGALELMAHEQVRGRDAVHAATALALGIGRVLSTDTAFDRVPGLTRVDPRDVAN